MGDEIEMSMYEKIAVSRARKMENGALKAEFRRIWPDFPASRPFLADDMATVRAAADRFGIELLVQRIHLNSKE